MPNLKDIADKLIHAFNTHDAAGLAQLYAEDQTTILPGAPGPVEGRKDKEALVAGYLRALPDLRLDISLVLTPGNHVVCEGHMRGTHTGPLVSPEGEVWPTGRAADIRMIFVLRVRPDGLIEEDRTYFDEAEFLKRLGLA